MWGYDVSPQALALCEERANARLHFKLADIRQEQDVFFDLLLLLDVVEHVEDYLSLLRDLKHKSRYKIFHKRDGIHRHETNMEDYPHRRSHERISAEDSLWRFKGLQQQSRG